MTIIQDLNVDIWSDLAKNGLSFVLLGIACYVLWQRDNAAADKMDKYIQEDRAKMLDCINANTNAFNMLKETLDEIKDNYKNSK